MVNQEPESINPSTSNSMLEYDHNLENLKHLIKDYQAALEKITNFEQQYQAAHQRLESQIKQNSHLNAQTQIQILQHRTAIDNLQNNMQHLSPDTFSNGHFHTLNQRKIELGKSKQFWSFWLFISVIALFLASLLITIFFISEYRKEEYLTFFMRYLLTSPILFFIILSKNQYDKDKKLEEQYAAKTAVSMSNVKD